MPALDIDSRPDAARRFTRVTFDTELATFTQLRLMRPTKNGPEVYRLPIAEGQHPAFGILFNRYDMAGAARNLKGAGGADYYATGRKSPVCRETGNGGWVVEYGSIPAHMIPTGARLGARRQLSPPARTQVGGGGALVSGHQHGRADSSVGAQPPAAGKLGAPPPSE